MSLCPLPYAKGKWCAQELNSTIRTRGRVSRDALVHNAEGPSRGQTEVKFDQPNVSI